MIPVLLLLALAAGVVLLRLGAARRAAAGIPEGRLVSMDTLGSASPGPTLYDPVLDLAGRPDYVVERNRNRIPVEVKSGNALAGPRRSHRLQLIAYCRLVEAVHARRPPHGILRYRDRAFQIPYSAEAEAELRGLLQEMRADRPSAPDRSHDSPARCRRCTFLGTCDQALGEIEKTRPL